MVLHGAGWDGLDENTRRAFSDYLDSVGRAGVTLLRASGNPAIRQLEDRLEDCLAACNLITGWENHWLFRNLVDQDPDSVSPRTRAVLEEAEARTPADYERALERRAGAPHAYARTMFRAAVHRARRILTVSEASKKDILRFFDVPPSKVSVIHNAVDDLFFERPPEAELARVRERYRLHRRFVMYSGNVLPHKNVERLIEAFAQVRRDGLDDVELLISGSGESRYPPLRRAVHRHGLHPHVRFLGYQAEATLAALYRLAAVFAFPSLYEGFGLPPLEAMASGTPAVVSNASSLPELVGDGAVLVDPYEPRDIADGIRRALDDAALREELRARGLARARSFSWPASVRRIHAIYREVAAGGG